MGFIDFFFLLISIDFNLTFFFFFQFFFFFFIIISQDTAVLTVHLIGAAMVFGLGVTYTGMHVVISRRSGVKGGLYAIRVMSWILSFIGLVTCISAAGVAYFQGHRNGTGTAIWDSDSDGFAAHVVSTFAEWLMGISFLIFFTTYYREFRPLQLDVLVKSIEGRHHAELKSDGTYEDDDEKRPLVNG